MAAVEMATLMHPFQAFDLSAIMDGYLASHMVLSEDYADDITRYDGDDEKEDNETANHDSGGAGDCNDATGSMDGGLGSMEDGMDGDFGDMDLGNFGDYIMEDDGEGAIDDGSEDEFGLKEGVDLEEIEEADAWYMYLKDPDVDVAFEDFVGMPIAKDIMANRAPSLDGLLRYTRIPEDDYERC